MSEIIQGVRDFEFYYLAELTRRKIKPLSRLEKPLPDRALAWLRRRGLYTESIVRKTITGKTVRETVFSTSRHYSDMYRKKFNLTCIQKSREDRKLEGFLFGYPACCVRQFTERPYLPGGLNRNDQALLFHWACQVCRCTPDLVPYYRAIHRTVSEWHRHEMSGRTLTDTFQKSLRTAASALLFAGGCLSAQTIADSTHYIAVPGDPDRNGLTAAEEVYLGTYASGSQSDNCRTFATLYKSFIDSLPDTVRTDRAYRINTYMRGVIQCPVCGRTINMGYITIVHPLRGLSMDIPCMGLHFMEKGFFSWGTGEDHQRIDIDTLKKIVYPYDAQHFVPVGGDSDSDGLTDAEEDSLWMEDTSGSPDFNNDGVPDGAGIAEALIRLFPTLKEQPDGMHTTVEHKLVWGLETCRICGSLVNMGSVTLTNPENGRTCEIPCICLHAMAHGSFAFDGSVHQNQRTDVMALYRTMKTHILPVSGDSDNDGLPDDEEKHFGFDPYSADSNHDGVPDGMELAVTFAGLINALPVEPDPNHPYMERLDMDGIHLCSVCGREIPMGVINICHPGMEGSPFALTNYAFHFLENGSFACDGAVSSRIDPVRLSAFLNYPTGMADQPDAGNMPRHFRLKQNHPNPFNPQTMIPYHVSEETMICLKVLDTAGREIRTLINRIQRPGDYSVIWDGKNESGVPAGSGLYLCRLTVRGASQTRKMLLIR